MKQKDIKKLKNESTGKTHNVKCLVRDMKRAAVLGADYIIATRPPMNITDDDIKDLIDHGYKVEKISNAETKIWFDLDAYKKNEK